MAEATELIDGSPTKQFFLEILTKDISITAAILDLVDNSVDSAKVMRGDGDFQGLRVDITATPQEFTIDDNCAGIGVENARDYVFRIGRPAGVRSSPASIGQFGVGMKRALFKLGSSFVVESTSAQDSFTVEVSTESLNDESDWTFPMTVHESPDAATGTTLIVVDLSDEVRAAFSSDDFLKELAEELRSRHRLPMGNGLEISLNGERLVATDSTVATSNLLKPAVNAFSITTPHFGELSVRIVVGVAPSGASGVDEDAEPEDQTRPAADAGWLVFGNGRLLLANDKSRLTGWGSGRNKLPQYHNQYARFRGFVYMTANNAGAIPWNTMKTTVDPDSPIWNQVLDQMIASARSVIDLLNQAKTERRLATDNMATPTLDAIRSATPADALSYVEVHFSMSMNDLRAPTPLGPVPAAYPAENPELAAAWKKIQYTVFLEAFEELASAIGTANAAEIGRLSFEAFHASNVES